MSVDNTELQKENEEPMRAAGPNDDDIQWDAASNGTKLDMEFYDELQSVVNFLWFYCGALAVSTFVGIVKGLGMFFSVSAIFNLLGVLAWTIYVVWRITHRKPNAVFQSRALLIVSLIYNLFPLLIAPSILGIVLVIVNVVCLFRVFGSSDFSVVFPKEYRQVSVVDWILLGAFFLIPNVVVFLCSFARIIVGI